MVKGQVRQLRELHDFEDMDRTTQLARPMNEHDFYLMIGLNNRIQALSLEIVLASMAR
jgi:hypothetical protein